MTTPKLPERLVEFEDEYGESESRFRLEYVLALESHYRTLRQTVKSARATAVKYPNEAHMELTKALASTPELPGEGT